MARRKQDYREHFDEYMELVGLAYGAETKVELRKINKQLRRTYGRGHTIPACWVFPIETKRLGRIAITLAILAVLISIAQIILTVATLTVAAW